MPVKFGPRTLGGILGVQPGEGYVVLRMAMVFGLYVFVLLLGRTVRDSLFLNAGLSRALPVMYIAVALSVIVSATLARRMATGRLFLAHSRNLAVVFAAVFAAIFGLLAERVWIRPVLFGLYLWVEIVGALLMVQFWGVANDHFDPRQAKRLYSLIAAGQVFGNLACGAVASILAPVVGTPALLLIIVAALLLSNALLRRASTGDAPAMPSASTSGPQSSPRDTPATRAFVGTLVVLSILTFVTTSLVDFQFKLDASQRFDQDHLTRFFGLFYGTVGFLAFFVQVFVSQRLVRGIGLFGTLAIMPAGFVIFGTMRGVIHNFWVGAALKGDEHLLRHTINDPLTQMLVIPLPYHRKRDVQQMLGGIVKPASIGLAGLVLVLLSSAVPADTLISAVALVGAFFSVIWLGVLFRASRQYVKLLAEAAQRFQHLSVPDMGYLGNARAASDLSRLLEHQRQPQTLDIAMSMAESSPFALDPEVLASIIVDTRASMLVRGRALVLLDRSDPAHAQWVIKSLGDQVPAQLQEAAQVLQYAAGGELPPAWHTTALDGSYLWMLELLLRAAVQRRERAGTVPRLEFIGLIETAMDWLHNPAIEDKHFVRLAQLVAPDDLARDALNLLQRAHGDIALQGARQFSIRVWRTRLMGGRRHAPLTLFESQLAEASLRGGSPTLRSLSQLARLESGDGSQWESSLASWLHVRNATTLRQVLAQNDLLLHDMPTLELLSRPMVHMPDRPRAIWPTLVESDPSAWFDAVERWIALPLPLDPLLQRSWQYAIHTRIVWLLRWAAVMANSGTLSQLCLHSIVSRPASRPMLIEVLDHELELTVRSRLITILEALTTPPAAGATLESWNQAPWTHVESILQAAGAYILDPSEATVEIIERIVHLSAGELFRALPLQSLARIADICESRMYATGELIIREGTAGDSLYLLVDGDVEVQKNRAGLKKLGRGACFGEISLLDDQPHSADIVAVTPCHCLRIGREDFEILLVDEPPFARAIMTGFAGRLRSKGGGR